MTIEQTVEIPASHRLVIDVPREVPAGRAQVIINFPAPAAMSPKAGSPSKGGGKIHLTREMVEEMLKSETLRSLTGILHTDMTLDEIRAERLKKHL